MTLLFFFVLRHLILKLGLQFLEFWQVSHNLTRNDINGEFIYLFIYFLSYTKAISKDMKL